MSLETKINKSAKSLTGFNGATAVTVATIDLDVYSPPEISSQIFMTMIIKINANTSATHQKIHYPIPGGSVGQINNDQAMARKCSTQGLKKGKQTQFLPMNQANLKGVEQAEEKVDPVLDGRAN
ncbi:unnamed protein product [Prunus armeniaca]